VLACSSPVLNLVVVENIIEPTLFHLLLTRHFGLVTLLRVAPPSKPKEGRRKPIAESVAIGEGRNDIPARQNFYRIIDDAIRNDTISEVRCFLYCETFFLRKGPPTDILFNAVWRLNLNNQRRIKAGYYKHRTSKKLQAKSGYDVFLDFRTLLLQRSKNSIERDRARVIAS
jgi:hypothetical protein